jgi:hypothetical protein
MAEPAEHIGTTIEALLGPTTRFRGRLRGPMTEQVELLQDLTLGNVLTTGITWEDFCLFCRNKIVWMTRDVYVYNGSIISHPGYELVAKLGSLNRLGLNLRVYAARLATFCFTFWQPVNYLPLTCTYVDLSVQYHLLYLVQVCLSFSKRVEAVFTESH